MLMWVMAQMEIYIGQQPCDINANIPTCDTVGPSTTIGKVVGYDSEYIDSPYPGSCDDTSEDSNANDAQRHKSSKRNYNPNIPLEDFCIDLTFKDLHYLRKSLYSFQPEKALSLGMLKMML